MSCTWCKIDKGGNALKTPYCADNFNCIVHPTAAPPAIENITPDVVGTPKTALIIGIVCGLVILILIVALIIVCRVLRKYRLF